MQIEVKKLPLKEGVKPLLRCKIYQKHYFVHFKKLIFMILVRPRISRHIRCLKFAIHAGLVFDEFSSFCDARSERARNDLYNSEFIRVIISVMNSGL